MKIGNDSPPEISVIVVSYNTADLTTTAISTLIENTATHFELIVIDNASDDNSADIIESRFPRIKLIRSEKNIGFAAANNLASNFATGKYILLLNPDTELFDNAVDQLFQFAKENPENKIWGGRTLFPDRTLNPSSCWNKQTLWSVFCCASGLMSLFRHSTLFNPEGIGGWDRQGIRNVDIVSGCFFMVERKLWQELGGFNERYFMYGEEADFCLRAKHLGIRPRVTSLATIIHLGGASEKIQADKLVRLLKAKQALIIDHFLPYTKLLGVYLLSFWPFTRYAVHSGLKIIGRKDSIDRAATWKNVWKRKSEWFAK